MTAEALVLLREYRVRDGFDSAKLAPAPEGGPWMNRQSAEGFVLAAVSGAADERSGVVWLVVMCREGAPVGASCEALASESRPSS